MKGVAMGLRPCFFVNFGGSASSAGGMVRGPAVRLWRFAAGWCRALSHMPSRREIPIISR